jgi:hypothetical protein
MRQRRVHAAILPAPRHAAARLAWLWQPRRSYVANFTSTKVGARVRRVERVLRASRPGARLA